MRRCLIPLLAGCLAFSSTLFAESDPSSMRVIARNLGVVSTTNRFERSLGAVQQSAIVTSFEAAWAFYGEPGRILVSTLDERGSPLHPVARELTTSASRDDGFAAIEDTGRARVYWFDTTRRHLLSRTVDADGSMSDTELVLDTGSAPPTGYRTSLSTSRDKAGILLVFRDRALLLSPAGIAWNVALAPGHWTVSGSTTEGFVLVENHEHSSPKLYVLDDTGTLLEEGKGLSIGDDVARVEVDGDGQRAVMAVSRLGRPGLEISTVTSNSITPIGTVETYETPDDQRIAAAGGRFAVVWSDEGEAWATTGDDSVSAVPVARNIVWWLDFAAILDDKLVIGFRALTPIGRFSFTADLDVTVVPLHGSISDASRYTISGAAAWQRDPAIATSGEHWLIAWAEGIGSTREISYAITGESGRPVAQKTLGPYTGGALAAAYAAERFIIANKTLDTPLDTFVIRLWIIGLDGSVLEERDIPLPDDPSNLAITSSGSQFLLSWHSTGVRALRLSLDGTPLDVSPLQITEAWWLDAVAFDGIRYQILHRHWDGLSTWIETSSLSTTGQVASGRVISDDTPAEADVACLPDRCLYVWATAGTDTRLMGLIVQSSDQLTIAGPFVIATRTKGWTNTPQVDHSSDAFFVTWGEEAPIYETQHVYATRVSSNGQVSPPTHLLQAGVGRLYSRGNPIACGAGDRCVVVASGWTSGPDLGNALRLFRFGLTSRRGRGIRHAEH